MAKDPKLKKIPIIEVFGPTMQGEGMVAGMRTIFIRFGLCDYECKMCDSMHAVDPVRVKAAAAWMTQEEIYTAVEKRCRESNTHNVTYSGGNPCIHDLSLLTQQLLWAGITISVETQGTKCPPWLDMCDYVTISPKSPGMGEKFEKDVYLEFMYNAQRWRNVCVKIVVFSAQDLQFATEVFEMTPWIVETGRAYLSLGNPYPPGNDMAGLPGAAHIVSTEELRGQLVQEYEQLQEDIKDYPILGKVRFLPQMHVLMFGNKQGV